MILLSHLSGNQNVRHALKAFKDADVLTEYVTTVATFDGNYFGYLAKTKIGAEFERRRYSQELAELTRQHPLWELGRMLANRCQLPSLTQHENGIFCVDSVYHHLDRFSSQRVKCHAQKGNLKAVYGYEDGAYELFKMAKSYGLTCVYDLPIAYYKTARDLLNEEAQRLPEWSSTLVGTKDSDKKYLRKQKELDLADIVICPSKFVRDSLPDVILNTKPVYIIPFGSPDITDFNALHKFGESDRMKVLFAGSMTQRKGLADVFSAMKLLNENQFELHVLGSAVVDLEFYKQQYSKFIYHPPCSHSEVLNLMRSCDVFVLPSIVEGRALVQQEALACGLPIIVTKNAGAEDLVEGDMAGFLVPIRNPQAIAEKLTLLKNDPRRLAEMKAAAYEMAGQVTWAAYRQQLVDVITSVTE